ncbi:MAG: aquaporin family protein [Actinomycetales bacterium]|nr:aquaporin family protein [Actinomycetales bacterium]
MTTVAPATTAPRVASDYTRRLLAELLGSGLLTVVVVGSGIMAGRLSPNETGLQLLENSIATALGLAVLILIFSTVSGSHFNPIVSLADATLGHRSWGDIAGYIPAQILGCVSGAMLANVMFGLDPITFSTKDRQDPAFLIGEVVATAGLVLLIFSLARTGRGHLAPVAVGSYIGAAYWFTSSTSFANPAIAIGRMFSDTFAGISPASAPGYIAAEIAGGALGLILVIILFPRTAPPHD